ncbi:hypothetical protein BASA50_010912 [Batrachochytrium salamandrivorans]|uniref:MSP domain-containing protein n=1 Tax=Batrachochytrium salamandrivorans TaxID=1357716 RepID=A0ABQ8EX67_9FUNG|nr:hypothetical protein BASA50_010912 [Batrachochytrium salamandrivorans]
MPARTELDLDSLKRIWSFLLSSPLSSCSRRAMMRSAVDMAANTKCHVGTIKRPSEYIRAYIPYSNDNPVQTVDHTHVTTIVEMVCDKESALRSCDVPLGRPLFCAEPSNITLQSFLPFKTYELVISFRNLDKTARRIHLESTHNPHFSVHGLKNDSICSGKVAPGMGVSFIVKFKPEENIDYSHSLVCVTEREKFILPIKAMGARGVLDLPDHVLFPECPVNHPSTKTLLVKNIGNSQCKFEIMASAPFKVSPTAGCLDIGKSAQIDVVFFSKETGSFESSLDFILHTGEVINVGVTGTAENANIKLEKSIIRMESTSITLASSKTLKIFNKSDIMVSYTWKMFSNEKEEEHFREKEVLISLSEENQERELYLTKTEVCPKSDMFDLSILAQKYKTRTRLIHNQLFPFDSTIFRIEPLSGFIWPGSFAEVKLSFSPQTAGFHEVISYCQVEGRETRLPLHLKGEARGPYARFSYDLLDLENVFINTIHTYEVILENKGEIAYRFNSEKTDTIFDPKFTFFPTEGSIDVGQKCVISITFCSNVLGDFLEDFHWNIEGSTCPLILSFKGSVIGPTFRFDPPILDFGKIAYGFPASRVLHLHNTSHISMKFSLRISAPEVDLAEVGFQISSDCGEVPALSSIQISVSINPRLSQHVSFEVVVDIEDVAMDMLRLPVYLESVAPEINVTSPLIDFGDCYIYHDYSRSISLVNDSEFAANFEIIPSQEHTEGDFSFISDPNIGIIQPRSKREGAPAVSIDVLANGLGPSIELINSELDWGKIQVLKDQSLFLDILNKSPIPASFSCLTVSEPSVFSIHPLNGIIFPGGKFQVEVVAHLNDAIKFSDILKLSIKSGDVYEIKLVARGQGSTIVVDERLRVVDFSDVFSNCECSAEFAISNKGRRTQSISWGWEDCRNSAVRNQDPIASHIFELLPQRFTIKPGAQQTVILRGYSNKEMCITEKLICQAMVGKEPLRKKIFESTVSANFITPLVELIPNLLKFAAIYTTDEKIRPIENKLSLRNTTNLPLHLSLKFPVSFCMEGGLSSLCLGPQERALVSIYYDPGLNMNRISKHENAKLQITYLEHPQKDSIELQSEISFPNLKFSTNSLNFDCLETGKENRRTLFMTNSSIVPVKYRWAFVSKNANEAIQSQSQAFDIQPLHGILQPGEKQEVEVYFYCHSGSFFETMALCDVDGGPKYELNLQGEASIIRFSFDRTLLDFGSQCYQSISEQEIFLVNTGQVQFDFTVIVFPNTQFFPKIMVSPKLGTLLPRGKQRISVRFCPCIPEISNGSFYIQVAHFEPTEIQVSSCGVFSRVSLDLPKVPGNRYDQIRLDMLLKHPKADGNIDISANVEEILLIEKTRDFVSKLNEEAHQKLMSINSPLGNFAGSILLYNKWLHLKLSGKAKAINMEESSHVQLVKYICDFGTVVRNTVTRRTFRIINTGSQSTSFSVDKSFLDGTGFVFEPEHIRSLPPGEGIEISVNLNSRKQAVGLVEVEMPIVIVGGPTITICLYATITVPDIHFSQDKIDFGEVLCGYRKSIPISIHNIGSTACDWSVITSDESALRRNYDPAAAAFSVHGFDISPKKGTLQQHGKSYIIVYFTPVENGDHHLDLPIKVAMNSRTYILNLRGSGVCPVVRFEPEVISVGPFLPYSESTETRFWIKNQTSYPLEVVAIDYDQQHQSESSLLRQFHLDDRSPLFLPSRELGSELPEFIHESTRQNTRDGAAQPTFCAASTFTSTPSSQHQAHYRKLSQVHRISKHTPLPSSVTLSSTSAQSSIAYIAQSGGQALQQCGDIAEELVDGGLTQRQNPTAESESSLDHFVRATRKVLTASTIFHNSLQSSSQPGDVVQTTKVSSAKPVVDIILHGPPFSGRTTQAKRIASYYDKVYIDLGEAIESELETSRCSLARSTILTEDKDIIPTRNTTVGLDFCDAIHPVPTRERPALCSIEGRDDEHDPKINHNVDRDHFVVSEAMISDIVRQRGQNRGVVIDGLDSKYATSTTLLKALLRHVADKGERAIIFNFGLDVSKIREREVKVQHTLACKELASLQINELSEDDYDRLETAERTKYDLTMRKCKKLAKEIEDRDRAERRHLEEGITNKSGDRKAEEEKMRNRKKGKLATGRAPSPEKTSRAVSPSKYDVKSAKSGKSPGSPKGARKMGTDRLERANEKDLRPVEKIDKTASAVLEKESDEDTMGRFGINEATFSSEATFGRAEVYFATLDSFLGVIKENDKSTSIPQNHPPAVTSLADKKLKPIKAAGVVEQTANITTPNSASGGIDNDVHPTDEAVVALHDINISAMNEDAVFKWVSDFIPKQPAEEPIQDTCEVVPQPALEQVYYFPDRLEPRRTRQLFTLLPSSITESDVQEQVDSITAAPDTMVSYHSTTSTHQTTIATKTESFGKSSQFDLHKPDQRKIRAATKLADDSRQLSSDPDDEAEKESLGKFRWILNPGELKELCIRFTPHDIGRFESLIRFETSGAFGKFSLQCIGSCQYNQIDSNYKKMFNKWRPHKDEQTMVHGEYIVSTGVYEYGPLLYSKARERYQDRFPENKATFCITNTSAADIKIFFSLRNDTKGDVFFFEPLTMDVSPLQTQTVSVWAYPKINNHFEDTFIVSIKDNPEPHCIKISCFGVKPELEIDKKHLAFERLLLGRVEQREIKLRNPTQMSVAWKIAGVDALGDEFTIPTTDGILESLQETTITIEFRGIKPIVIKRVIRIEVSDTEKISGVVQDFPVVITAEAYDVSMDLHFPKGFDGGLDFGILKVLEEGKQLCTLKNKGKYEVGFRFVFEGTKLGDYFGIVPMQGVIQPSEKPLFVQVVFKSNAEVFAKDSLALRCIFFEPTTGEVTASVPIKINARAVFSKFSVLPVRDLSFGSLIHGTKVARQFIIENKGEFDFKYSIYKLIAQEVELKATSKNRLNYRTGKPAHSISPPPASKVISNRKEITKPADMLNFGAFTLSPTNGTIMPGTKQSITVEFHADSPGIYDEIIGIDISDRAPADCSDILEYRLAGESCIPGINTTDFKSIFEEQSVCKHLELFNTQNNVYAEDDRVFYFGAVLVGQQVVVNFKISNPFKVSCDISLAVRPRGKAKSDNTDFAFDTEVKRLTIPSHEYRYTSVTFHPTYIQSYAGVFEAVVENVQEGNHRVLSFELRGEGTLPRIVIDKPTLKSKSGLPLLKFKRLLLNTIQTLPVVFRNDGIISAKFALEWIVKDTDDIDCPLINEYQYLKPQEQRTFQIKFRPMSVRKYDGELRMKIVDNSFEDSSFLVTGEGYLDDLTFEELNDGIENEIILGDCFIGESKNKIFRVCNHSSEWTRVSFDGIPEFLFSPSVAHIKPRGDREVSVCFSPKSPQEILHSSITIKATKIRYQASPNIEWDNRMKIVRWVGAENNHLGATTSRKVVEQYPEPSFETIISPTNYTLLISALAEYSMYECEATAINFKNTLMFQSRVYRFSLRNSGKVILQYAFSFYEEDGVSLDSLEKCPFSIYPVSGTIPANESVMITVRFSPNNVGDYCNTILCSMPNLSKDMKPLMLKANGTSLRPLCHFELEDSDYITSSRRNPERFTNSGVPLILEANTKVIEFISCGVRGKNLKRFYILNPTNLIYEYTWVSESQSDSNVFKCLTLKGVITPNKKSEIVFEFNPDSTDIKESLWTFMISEHNIRVPFLLVGQAAEPNIRVDQAGVNFKSVLVGRQVKEIVKLINDEKIPFSFAFSDLSVEMGCSGVSVLRISPTSGTLPANSEIPIEVVFSPSSEKVYNLNLECNIRKKPTPVTINVKGEGYEIHGSLQTELVDGTVLELLPSTTQDNILDFGQVQINEKRVRRICISNSGKFNFDFAWKFPMKDPKLVSIVPNIGTVIKGERTMCDVFFAPTSAVTIKDIRALCHIINGQTYPLSISGTGTKPLLKFSESSVEFGPRYVYSSGMSAAAVILQISNVDVKEISFDIISLDVAWLDIQCNSNSLSPGESTHIAVSFTPREPGDFAGIIRFEINGLSTVDIPVRGEAIEYRVEPDIRQLNFGALRAGQTVVRSVKLTNKSKLPSQFSIGPLSAIDVLSRYGVRMSQTGSVLLKPKSSITIEVTFLPHARIPAFSEELHMDAAGITYPLISIAGACQGIDVRLESNSLTLGAVVQHSCTTRRIQLLNVGEIGAKFYWNPLRFSPDFSISPSEGYVSPGMEIPLEISFHPTQINPDIRYENIPCEIDGVQSTHLTLTGICIPQPAQNDTIKFSTPVRSPDMRSIHLSNKTSSTWHIKPIIEGNFWHGSEMITVEAGQTKGYDITFIPLETNGMGEGERHEGTVFFPLPDGNGILYKLLGVADKPLIAGNINREIPCKTSFTEILAVGNWLKRVQRFHAIFEVGRPDQSVLLKGHDFIEVPPLLSKDYKLNFYAYKEGVTNVKVMFRNESTQEYITYNLTYKATPAGVVACYDMTATVRQLCTRDIVIFNPLSMPTSFSGTSNNPDIAVPHSFTIPPRSEGICTVEFLPLLPKETTSRVVLSSVDLGFYQYDLILTSTPAAPERTLQFKIGFGSSQTQTLRFISLSKSRTDFTCRIDSPEFLVEKSISVPAATTGGVETSIDITYEASKLGDTRSQLVISSLIGGDYIYPLSAHCAAPRPQGPIIVRPGAASTLLFKNVLNTSATFNFVVDNSAFIVKAAETVAPKKTIQLSIGFKQSLIGGAIGNGTSGTATLTNLSGNSASSKAGVLKVGKLTITHATSNMSWVYYLRYIA